MKILILGRGNLYPANRGGRIRSSKLFEHLSRFHDITWVGFQNPSNKRSDINKMRACCHRIETIDFAQPSKWSLRYFLIILSGLISRYPHSINRCYVPEVTQRIIRLVKKMHYDLLICDFLQPSRNVLQTGFYPRILFQHNVESVIIKRRYQISKNLLERLYLYFEWQKLLRYEAFAARQFNHCIMVSQKDCRAMTQLFDVTNTTAIPNGVDIEYFRPAPINGEKPNHLVFTGAMDWPANVDAVRFFAEQILPRVRHKTPVKLWVVGRNPRPELYKLSRRYPEIEITGTVDDVRPFVARASLYIVPLRIGGGTRLKIFEALAMGKAVLSTTVGAEGLPVKDGRNILISDTAEGLASNTLKLLSDHRMRRALGEAGRRLVAQNFSWEKAAQKFMGICEKVVIEHKNRGTS